jgi:hypothetical protein
MEGKSAFFSSSNLPKNTPEFWARDGCTATNERTRSRTRATIFTTVVSSLLISDFFFLFGVGVELFLASPRNSFPPKAQKKKPNSPLVRAQQNYNNADVMVLVGLEEETELTSSVENMEASLTKLEQLFQPFFMSNNQQLQEKLTPFEDAKLNILKAYAVNTLFYSCANVLFLFCCSCSFFPQFFSIFFFFQCI